MRGGNNMCKEAFEKWTKETQCNTCQGEKSTCDFCKEVFNAGYCEALKKYIKELEAEKDREMYES